jgi:hypothetical protein
MHTSKCESLGLGRLRLGLGLSLGIDLLRLVCDVNLVVNNTLHFNKVIFIFPPIDLIENVKTQVFQTKHLFSKLWKFPSEIVQPIVQRLMHIKNNYQFASWWHYKSPLYILAHNS